MTTPLGPACDLCQEEQSIMSVMDLRDHSQVLIGAGCMLAWFQGMVAALNGAEQGDTDTSDPAEPAPPGPAPDPAPAGEVDQAPEAAPVRPVRVRRHGHTAP